MLIKKISKIKLNQGNLCALVGRKFVLLEVGLVMEITLDFLVDELS